MHFHSGAPMHFHSGVDICPYGIKRTAEARAFSGHAAAGIFVEPLAARRLQRVTLKMVGLIRSRHTHVTDQHRTPPEPSYINTREHGFGGNRKMHGLLRQDAAF